MVTEYLPVILRLWPDPCLRPASRASWQDCLEPFVMFFNFLRVCFLIFLFFYQIFMFSPPLFDHWTLKSQNSCSRLMKLLIFLQFNILQGTSDYRQGTGGRKSAPIIGRAVNQILDFLTSARQKNLDKTDA